MTPLSLDAIKPVCSLLDDDETPASRLLFQIKHANSELALTQAILDIPRIVGTSGDDYGAMIEASAARRIAFELEVKKCECGYGHADQIKKYPLGSKVISISKFNDWKAIIEVGVIGIVNGHCNDGRASIDFGKHGAHTFHFPESYIFPFND